MRSANLYDDSAAPAEGERCDVLLRQRNLVVERIVSSAAIAPCEYVQTQDEWVVLLQGDAVLDVAGQTVVLKSGDHLFLPAGVAHSVERVSDGAIWLAVHLHPDAAVASEVAPGV